MAPPAPGQVRQLAERETRELNGRCLVALARRGKVPNIALSHQAYRVLQFLLGQRPGYFAHQKVIADAVESNLTTVRKALFELRDAGLVSWDLIPPHHPLPTGKYTRTNVNQYFVEADTLLRALGGDEAAGPPRTVASTHPNSSASTGTDPKFEQDPPLPPSCGPKPRPVGHSGEGEIQFSKFQKARPEMGQPRATAGVPRADPGHSPPVPPELEKVLAAWRTLDLGEPDDRSMRALRNRHAEGATSEQLAAAVEGARHDEWLRQGRAKSPFAVVFASLASVERFAEAGREHARKTEAEARHRATERRAARARFDDVAALSPAENAELAAHALRSVAYSAPPIRSNYSPIPTTNFSALLAISPAIMARPREIPCTKVTAEITSWADWGAPMTIDRDEAVGIVARFYLESPDFNGCPATKLVGPGAPEAEVRSAIEAMVTSSKLEALTSEIADNPHIKRFHAPPVEKQVDAVRSATTLDHVCVYPHPDALKGIVDVARYDGKPFELDLALGASQLEPRVFDLTVLEFYRNDPRYHYACDDVHGWISLSDDHYRSSSVPERDQILLDTFGFAYNDKLDRAVTTFLRYLANLTPEHQQIWRAKQLGSEFKMHPDFFRTQILAEWPERLPILTAFWMELELINKMTVAMGYPPLFRETAKRPKNFAFLIRPTLAEFNDFALVLDKLISENLNRKFFEKDLDLEEESPRADGKIVVRQKGTLALLDEWFRKKFRTPDWTPFEETLGAFREIRKLRQSPAHGLESDSFDQKYFHEQRELVIKGYNGVRTLRLMLEKHPASASIEVNRLLRDGKIADR